MTSFHTRRDSAPGTRKPAPISRVAQVYLDVRRKVLHCLNDTARQLAGEGVPFTSGDLAKRPLTNLAGDVVTSADLPLLRAYRERGPREAVFVLPEADDRVWHLTWHAAPLSDSHGDVIGVLATMRMAPPEPDWGVLAGLAHDLRTPLQSLRLLTALLGQAGCRRRAPRWSRAKVRAAAERAPSPSAWTCWSGAAVPCRSADR